MLFRSHYIAACPPARLRELALPYFVAHGWLPSHLSGAQIDWFDAMLTLFAPAVDRLDQLPERAACVFTHDPATARNAPENESVLAAASAKSVLDAFGELVRAEASGVLTGERFKAIMSEVKAAAGAKGKELFHPVRIVLTGSHSGPEFDKLVPLIESGSKLSFPKHVLSVRERVEQWMAGS